MSRRNKNRSGARERPATSAPPPPTKQNTHNWRDHPLVVAALVAAGTFTLTTFAFKEIIIPTQIADIQNKIRDLPSLEQNIENLRQTNQKSLNTIQDLKRKIEALQQKDLFAPSSPIPSLLDKLRIGQPITDAQSNFPHAKFKKNEEMGYWSVDFGYGVISSATYYYDEKSKDKHITHILYWLSDELKLSDKFLQDRLTESLGPPTKTPRKGFYEWHTKTYNVFLTDEANYVVMGRDSRPGYWPE